ncbi:hypothetical protein ScPMuIL_017169 [Solemya velum]
MICAIRCAKDDNCKSFSYGKTDIEESNCIGYPAIVPEDMPLTEAFGWMLFAEVGNMCAIARDLVDDVADNKLTASSIYAPTHSTERARLSTVKDFENQGAWSAGSNDGNQFIQVEFDNVKRVTRIATKGRNQVLQHNQWVKSYSVAYSADGFNWRTIEDFVGNTKVFDGNTDTDSLVVHDLTTSFNARFVRLLPVEWHVHVSMRFGIFGCDTESD